MPFLQKIKEAFYKESIPFAIVGGYAVAIHGVARGTLDMDIVTEISEDNLIKIEKLLQSLDYKAQIPNSASDIFQNRQLYLEERSLVAWSFRHSSHQREILDIILTEDIRQMVVVHAQTNWGELPVVSLEDLILMKSKSRRPQDVEDVRALQRLRLAP